MSVWDSRAGAGQPTPRTAGEALEAYARGRMAGKSPPDQAGMIAFLELVGRFCDEIAPDLLDPVTRRRLEKQAGDHPPRDILDARRLYPLLLPCARMYPFLIAASSGVTLVFSREIPRLAAWLVDQGLGEAGVVDRFEQGWALARADMERLVVLQLSLARVADVLRFARPDYAVVGHYLITEVSPQGLWVDGGEGAVGPVRVPRDCLGLFSPGQEASMAFFRGGAGWIPLACSLPYRTEEMAAMMDQARGWLTP